MISDRIFKELTKFNRIGVAVSGGADSMALLHYLYYHDFNVIVVNIEHGIRGESSVYDTEFVKSFCDTLSIPCKVFRVDSLSYAKEFGMTTEQAARVLRHDILKKFSVKHGIPIATAHHKLDQSESVFMHIARGAGIDGLTGMTFLDGHLIRPLIDTCKEDIIEYVTSNEVPYVDDETNSDDYYSRNYVRNVIFPTITERYPSFADNLVKLSKRAVEIKELIDELMPKLELSYGSVLLNLSGVHRVLAASAIMKACDILGVTSDIEERHIDAILELPENKRIDLPHGLTAYNEYGMIAIALDIGDKQEYALSDGRYGFGYGELEIISSDKALKGYKQLDYAKLNAGAVIRTRRDGDKISLSYGSKNISDILTDKKIPLRLRDSVPIIESDGDLVAVGDIEVSPNYRITNETKKVINFKWTR